ncbi:hypothetical protein PR048_028154 [Dryococelus australis]|uniref:Uncharacterized protein n=1 Tax=Dryococelus australis TaxID=614101 RepID=A0ABQ9GIG4_9NEOP|nr:hypothetical protein PR048_028154 [Dryococelus australis]
MGGPTQEKLQRNDYLMCDAVDKGVIYAAVSGAVAINNRPLAPHTTRHPSRRTGFGSRRGFLPDFRMSESCRTMSADFFRGSLFSPALSFRRISGSQDIDVKSRPNPELQRHTQAKCSHRPAKCWNEVRLHPVLDSPADSPANRGTFHNACISRADTRPVSRASRN